jgi:hypothetical protein
MMNSCECDDEPTGSVKCEEMSFLRRISRYTLTDHVRDTTIRNALQMYALGKRI